MAAKAELQLLDETPGAATGRGREPSPTLVHRVVIRNYKSIAACDVTLGQLSFLVGPNGSGKSNFLDALRFVADSLRSSLDHALRDRGGINEVRRRSSGHPTHFGIRLEFVLSSVEKGHYAFNVGAKSRGSYAVQREECHIVTLGRRRATVANYVVEDGEVRSATPAPLPKAAKDRLFLVVASGLPQFRHVYDAFASMGFYNLSPAQIRELQPPDPGELLSRDGSNLPSVLGNLRSHGNGVRRTIEEYLARVVPGVSGVAPKVIGPKETLEFLQQVKGSKHPWRFLAANMSDGTLRALGVLVALFQGQSTHRTRARLVGIEEPETALHPAAAGILRDGLRQAARSTQVLVTSHSPDLLDDKSIPDREILAVYAEHGETHLGPLDDAGRSALRDHLYTAGELHRMDQLRPDPVAATLDPDQLTLFGQRA